MFVYRTRLPKLKGIFVDPLIRALSSFVAIPSVSNSEQHREDCRQAGLWLKRCLGQLGADAKMVEQASNNTAKPSFLRLSFRLQQDKGPIPLCLRLSKV